MAEKWFLHHTRPITRKELKQSIADIDRQIHYWESIGHHEYDIEYWRDKQLWWKKSLAQMDGLC